MFSESGHKAIIGVDAGKTTGLAWGMFSPRLRDNVGLWHALARGRRCGWAEVGGGEDMFENGVAACKRVTDLIGDWNMGPWGIGVGDVIVMVEHFQVQKRAVGGTFESTVAPVFVTGMLTGALIGAGWGRCLAFCMPSESKALGTDARLRALGRATGGRRGWVRGKRHARDAWRLVSVGLEKTP